MEELGWNQVVLHWEQEFCLWLATVIVLLLLMLQFLSQPHRHQKAQTVLLEMSKIHRSSALQVMIFLDFPVLDLIDPEAAPVSCSSMFRATKVLNSFTLNI